MALLKPLGNPPQNPVGTLVRSPTVIAENWQGKTIDNVGGQTGNQDAADTMPKEPD